MIHTQITWCFQSFDVFIAVHLLYSLVTSEFEGVRVGLAGVLVLDPGFCVNWMYST